MVIEWSFLEPDGERNDNGCINWCKWCGGIELIDACLYNIGINGSIMKHQKENVQDLSRCIFRCEIAGRVSPDVYLGWSPSLVKMRCQLDAFIVSQPFYPCEIRLVSLFVGVLTRELIKARRICLWPLWRNNGEPVIKRTKTSSVKIASAVEENVHGK